jgi:hypothetical protein
MTWPRHPQSTRPMKRGPKPSTGNCSSMAELEAEVAKRRALGWSANRIANRFKINWPAAKRIITKLEGNT